MQNLNKFIDMHSVIKNINMQDVLVMFALNNNNVQVSINQIV